jgi:hypothetical protein
MKFQVLLIIGIDLVPVIAFEEVKDNKLVTKFPVLRFTEPSSFRAGPSWPLE